MGFRQTNAMEKSLEIEQLDFIFVFIGWLFSRIPQLIQNNGFRIREKIIL